MSLYQARNLNFYYHLGEEKIPALKNVAVEIPKEGLSCLSGPSGSGKTTLLNVLGLIEDFSEGEVFFEGRDLKHLSEIDRNHIRRHKIGFIFQTFQLFPTLSAAENVEYFLTRQGVVATERKQRVEESLNAVGLWEHRSKRPLQMSGGQRQRVAIARAIAKRPQVIIADEPTASLDQKTGREVMEILKKFNREKGVGIIVSSHDTMVHGFADRIIRLRDGLLQEEGAL